MDEGVDPTNMCERLVLSMRQDAALQAVAPPGLRALFDDWMGQLENEVLAEAKRSPEITPEILARTFNISVEGSAFLLERLKSEGRI